MSVYLKGFLIACKGIPATVAVSLIAIVIGAAFGLLLALCSQTKSKVLQVLAKVYIDVVRGTPMLVQALIMAYGIP
jgi:polar amino acid transport system permease protein